MLAGVLSVLKIIGIVLLVILAVILVLILLVLFVPIFYRVDAHVPETELDHGFDVQKVDASVKFSWLLFVIRGGISFPRDKEFTLRVFGVKILPKKEKDSKEKSEIKKEDDKEQASGPGIIEMSDMGTENDIPENDAPKVDDKDDASADADNEEDLSSASDDIPEDESENKTFIDVIWNIIDKIENILKTPLNVFEKIQYTISRVCDKIDMIKSTLENEIFKRAFELVKKKLLKLIRMILPDRCRIDAVFGTGDPALTAEVFGAFAAMRPFLSKKLKIRVSPDFDRKVVYTDTHIKGHITLFAALYITATCYFNRDVKKTIRRFKKILDS